MCQGEVCTDDDDDANDDDAQRMIIQGSLVDKPNEPKIITNLWEQRHLIAV